MNRHFLLIVFTKQTFLHFNSTYDLLSLYAQSHFTCSKSYTSAFFMIIPSCIIFRQSVAITIRAAVHYHRNPRFFFYLTDRYLGTHWLSSSAAKTSWMEWWTTHCIKANHNLEDLSTITAGGEICQSLPQILNWQTRLDFLFLAQEKCNFGRCAMKGLYTFSMRKMILGNIYKE